jgi:hypothetical protein
MIKKICVAVGEYKDNAGTTKTNWETIGSLIEKNGREYIALKPFYDLSGLYLKQCQLAKAQGKTISEDLFLQVFEDVAKDEPKNTSKKFEPPPMPNIGDQSGEVPF